MKSICTLLLVSLTAIFQPAFSAEKTPYFLSIDVNGIENDQVKVTVYPPKTEKETVVYNMPKIVPGTYSVSDFGRFISGLKALDQKGNELPVKQLDANRWEIQNAGSLEKIEYWVDDTFDAEGSDIFEPGGTNIEAGKNVVLNVFGFAGYLDEMKDNPYQLEVIKPTEFYGETSLPRDSSLVGKDYFFAKDYFELHDCPILYAAPDTASMMVGNTRIAISVFSPSGGVTSAAVLDEVRDLFPAAAEYLGGTLPVDQYSILLYLNDGTTGSGGFGALEHNTSTVFVLPDAPVSALAQTIRDVTAHEFFHIVTPLNIHSVEIDDYDFMNPQMSKHLWLYEGCTEYAAQHVQVKQGLFTMEEFLGVIREKMRNASHYDTGVAFTELSKKALDEHADQYGNVYEQGALIGMALDLKLRILSNGDYGIQDLMRGLADEYGMSKPFQDDQLFSEIARVSGFPEMEGFLEKYVAGTEPIPFAELLAAAGILYTPELNEETISAGGIGVGYNPRSEKMVVAAIGNADDFGKAMGFQKGDELVSWNGEVLTLDNTRQVLDTFKENTQPGDKVKVVIQRTLENGKVKSKTLKGKAISTEVVRRDVLEPMENPSPEQLAIRKAWINV